MLKFIQCDISVMQIQIEFFLSMYMQSGIDFDSPYFVSTGPITTKYIVFKCILKKITLHKPF